MAIILTLSNHYKYQLMKKQIDLSASGNTLIIILMNDSFVFDKATHATLADVTADQLPTEYGYTQDNKELTNKVLSEDDVNNKGKMVCDDPSWIADGGSIGPSGSAIVYDDTTDDDTVVGCADYGEDYIATDGLSFKIEDIEIDTK